MHLPLPDDIEEERENNGRLTDVLRLDNVDLAERVSKVYLDYVHPEASATKPPREGTSDGGETSGEDDKSGAP